MAILLFPLLLAASLSLAQTTCIKHTPVQPGPLVLRYTPYVTPQVAPISTVYRAIVTTYFNVVDCQYLSVERVDDNEPAIGPFTTRTTVDALTITRVGCIAETTMITRRNVDAQPVGSSMHDHSRRNMLQANILATAIRQAEAIPPDTQSISVRAYGYLVQVNTAIFAINLYNTGFNMSATCTLLSDPVTQARLLIASVNPSQAASIICYAAQNGLYFGMSNSKLLSDLLGIIYSIQIKSGVTQNATVICNDLQLDAASFLGIDTEGIQDYICDGQPPSTRPTIIISTSTADEVTTVASTGFPTVTGTGGVSPITAPPFANSTTYTNSASRPASGSGSIPSATWPNKTLAGESTVLSNNATVPTATYLNGTYNTVTNSATYTYVTGTSGQGLLSESFSVIFPNTTANANASAYGTGRYSPSPYSQIAYGAWTTSIASTPSLPRY